MSEYEGIQRGPQVMLDDDDHSAKMTALWLNLSLKLREAEEAAYALARECEVGPERTRMFDVHERIRRVMVD